jgi:hypothetical protein
MEAKMIGDTAPATRKLDDFEPSKKLNSLIISPPGRREELFVRPKSRPASMCVRAARAAFMFAVGSCYQVFSVIKDAACSDEHHQHQRQIARICVRSAEL